MEDNVALGAYNNGLDKAELRRRVTAQLARVRLEGAAKLFPQQLSGGMAQRVSIARMLMGSRRLLLLDEPFSALDAFTRLKLQVELEVLWNASPMTMILVTHDIEEAAYLSDRIVVMDANPGRIRRIVENPRDRATVCRRPSHRSRPTCSRCSTARIADRGARSGGARPLSRKAQHAAFECRSQQSVEGAHQRVERRAGRLHTRPSRCGCRSPVLKVVTKQYAQTTTTTPGSLDGAPKVLIASACSGHGFKYLDSLGEPSPSACWAVARAATSAPSRGNARHRPCSHLCAACAAYQLCASVRPLAGRKPQLPAIRAARETARSHATRGGHALAACTETRSRCARSGRSPYAPVQPGNRVR